MDSLELLLLTMDEVVDGGMILETDRELVEERVLMKGAVPEAMSSYSEMTLQSVRGPRCCWCCAPARARARASHRVPRCATHTHTHTHTHTKNTRRSHGVWVQALATAKDTLARSFLK